MKFLQSSRETFTSDNYNPPPGYYIGIDSKEQQVLQVALPQSSVNQHKLGSIFLKAPRFPEDKSNDPGHVHNYQNVFGFDKIANQQSSREQQRKQKLVDNNFVQQSQKVIRRKTVSHKQAAEQMLSQMQRFLTSQPLGQSQEGSKIFNKQQRLKEQLNELQNKVTSVVLFLQQPGPGEYDAKIAVTKPRVKGFVIRKDDQNKEDEKSSPVGQAVEQLIWGKGLQTVYYDPKQRPSTSDGLNAQDRQGNDSERGFRPPSFMKLREKQRLLFKNTNQDVNLELMLHREKSLPKQQQVPPPGWYYSEETFSQFGKSKEKVYQNQCFESRQPRFKKEDPMNQLPGPGEYEIREQTQPKNIVISKTIAKEPQNDLPGVGEYELRKSLIKQKQQINLPYPAIFGSSVKRDLDGRPPVENNGSCPGPGSYNIAGKPKKPPKYVMKTTTSTAPRTPSEIPTQIMFGLSVNAEDQGEIFEMRKRSKSRKNRQINKQHMFSSEVKRFIPNDSAASSEIGPGIYNLATDIKRRTFNVSSRNFSQDPRKFAMRGKMQTTKSVGPGSYELNTDSIKERKTQDIIFK